jgi:hypothetical protein
MVTIIFVVVTSVWTVDCNAPLRISKFVPVPLKKRLLRSVAELSLRAYRQDSYSRQNEESVMGQKQGPRKPATKLPHLKKKMDQIKTRWQAARPSQPKRP